MCSQYVTVLFFAVSEFLKCVRSGLLGFVVFVSWFILSVLLFEFLRHCHKFLCSNSLAVGQESGSCESTFLSVRGVKLVYKQVKRKIPADSTMCNPTRRAGMRVCTRPRRHAPSGSRIRSKLVSLLCARSGMFHSMCRRVPRAFRSSIKPQAHSSSVQVLFVLVWVPAVSTAC